MHLINLFLLLPGAIIRHYGALRGQLPARITSSFLFFLFFLFFLYFFFVFLFFPASPYPPLLFFFLLLLILLFF